MRAVHKDVFDEARVIFDRDGYNAAKRYLINATKKPYPNRHIVPIEMPEPKLELKPVSFASRFNEM